MNEGPPFKNIINSEVAIESLPESGFNLTPEFSRMLQGFIKESFLGPEHGAKYDEGGNAEIFLSSHPALEGLCLKHLKTKPDMKIMDIRSEAALQNKAHKAGVRTPLVLCYAIIPETGDEFLVMEYVDGPNLGTIRDGAKLLPDGFETRHVRDFIRDLTAQVAILHAHGIHHRDLKPENLLVTPDGKPVIIDFGVATEYHGSDEMEPYLYSGQIFRDNQDGIRSRVDGCFVKDTSHIQTAKSILASYFKPADNDDYGFGKLARM